MRNALIGIATLAVAVAAFADYTPMSVESATTVSGSKTYSGTSTFSGAVVVADDLVLSSTASSVTNGQALTVAEPVYVLTGTGGGNDTTNTITIANAASAGQTVLLVVSATSSNLIGLADSGNLKLSGAAVLDNNDNILLYAAATNVWVEVSKTDN